MKKTALVGIGFLMLITFVGIGFGTGNPVPEQSAAISHAKITAAQAREIALKRVPGKVVENYVIDGEKGGVEFYVFVIKATDGKRMEVMIGADKGDVMSVENYEMDDDPSENS